MKWWSWSIPFVAAVALYLPTLDAELVWDDEIVQTRQLVAFQSVRDVFFPPDGIQEWARSYYRPLVVMSYLLDRALYGNERFGGHHLTNILIHALVCVCVTLLARRVLLRHRLGEWGAVAAGLIFAVHPIHVESISPIMGRSDTLAAAFMLPSIILSLHYRDHPRALWALAAAPLLYLAALLAKEVAISTLPLLPLLLAFVPRAQAGATLSTRPPQQTTRRSKKKRKKARRGERAATPLDSPVVIALRWVPFGVLYLIATATYFVLRDRAGCTVGNSLGLGLGSLLDRACRAVAYYVARVVALPPQSAFVTMDEMPSLTLGVVAIIIGIAAGRWALRLRRRGDATLLIAWLWFVLSLAPSMAIAVRKISEQPVAERYLYLPSVAVSLLVGGWMCRVAVQVRLRAVSFAGVTLIAGLFVGQTLAFQRVWHDNIAFWMDTSAKAPKQGLPIYQLGLAYNRTGTSDRAFECFNRALALYDDAEGRSLAHNSIGTVQRAGGDQAAAEASFRAAIRERPRYRTPYFNLGALQAEQAERARARTGMPDVGLLESAHQHFATAVRLSPSYVKAQYMLAQQTVLLADARTLAGETDAARDLMKDARDRIAWLAVYDARGEFGGLAAARVPVINDALRRLGGSP